MPEDEDSYYYRRKKHDPFCKRAGTKPVIEHLKADHRLCRNFYAGVFGDNINVMLAAAGFNRREMRINPPVSDMPASLGCAGSGFLRVD